MLKCGHGGTLMFSTLWEQHLEDLNTNRRPKKFECHWKSWWQSPPVMFPVLADSSKGQPDVAYGSGDRERERGNSQPTEIDSEGEGKWWKERKRSERGRGDEKKQTNIQGFSTQPKQLRALWSKNFTLKSFKRSKIKTDDHLFMFCLLKNYSY